MSLTCPTLIELLEYVLRNAARPGPSGLVAIRSLPADGLPCVVCARAREGPLDDRDDDSVSSECASCPDPPPELGTIAGTGGTISAGDSSPFLVALWVGECRESRENRFFVLGADATRRMNRDALADMFRGDSGPPCRGGVVALNDCCDELAVAGGLRLRFFVFSRLSDFVRSRVGAAKFVTDGEGEGMEDLSPAGADRPWWRRAPESLECVSDELYEYRFVDAGVRGTWAPWAP